MAKRITVLLSGRGSNLAALLAAMREGTLGGTITCVISNRPEAPALALARAAGVPTVVVDHRQFATRDAFDLALAFACRFAGRLINVHPSLLPLYPGLHTHRRALDDGARLHGCTVHFVTADVDVGPIIAQAAVPVLDDDDEGSLAARVLAQEHLLLPAAVRWFCEDRLVIAGRRVRVKGVPDATEPAALRAPPT